MTQSLENLQTQVSTLAPLHLNEIVMQTNRYEAMRAWYAAALGVVWTMDNRPTTSPTEKYKPGERQVRAVDVRASFGRLGVTPSITFALFELPWLRPSAHMEPGINHTNFREADLETLVKRVEFLRDAGIHPHRVANHGPVMSFYFYDPDENIVEFCSMNFDTPEEMMTFVKSEAFQKNPSGVELERDSFLERYHSGIPKKELLKI
jgi:catechol 2,3-dioxygenase-like lactoylglutathione lyase family enzyme